MWPFLLFGAGVGALLGGLNTWRERDRQEKAIKMQKESAENAYGYGKALSDNQYDLQKGESLWQLGMQHRALGEGMNQFTDEYNTRLLAMAYGEQDARIQTASGIGAHLAQEGASGTRGNAANQLVRDYASNSLERQIDVQRKQDADVLAGTIQNANRSITAMEHEKNSWEPGGYRHEAKTANDIYNEQMFKLGQKNYQFHLDDMNDPLNFVLDYTAGIFGGASSGMGFAHDLYNYDWNWNSGFDYKNWDSGFGGGVKRNPLKPANKINLGGGIVLNLRKEVENAYVNYGRF